jgi:hypothetical protein
MAALVVLPFAVGAIGVVGSVAGAPSSVSGPMPRCVDSCGRSGAAFSLPRRSRPACLLPEPTMWMARGGEYSPGSPTFESEEDLLREPHEPMIGRPWVGDPLGRLDEPEQCLRRPRLDKPRVDSRQAPKSGASPGQDHGCAEVRLVTAHQAVESLVHPEGALADRPGRDVRPPHATRGSSGPRRRPDARRTHLHGPLAVFIRCAPLARDTSPGPLVRKSTHDAEDTGIREGRNGPSR